MAQLIYYRLSLDAGLEAFRTEIEYACEFVDSHYGLRRRLEAGTVLHYGVSPPAGAVHVPSVLFPGCIRKDANGLHIDRVQLATIEASLLPGATRRDCPGLSYDALGLIFFLLSRIEERGCTASDRYDRFPASQAFTVRHGLHLDPPADRAAEDIAAALTGIGRPVPATSFSVRLTHDVDRLRAYHRRLDWLRPAFGDLIRRRDPRAAWKRCRSVIGSGEPWQSFQRLMDIEEGYGQKGHYYFMGPTRLSMDSPYAADMAPLLRQVIGEVHARGHVVGFHPGYATCADADEWFRQRNGLEAIAGLPVREGRQHVLRYRADITPDIWEAGGMTYDCSLAYPEVIGFRPGTCRQFHAYSLRHRKRLQLRQGASAICDFALMGGKYQELSIEDALAECDKAIAVCQRHGGELVVLFHTGLPELPWFEFYERLLSRIFR
jgi:hypothetical protein